MFKDFQYKSIPLDRIRLDPQNPRIVTEIPLKDEHELVEYLVENEDLISFIHKIAQNGKNPGAERPYVIREDDHYIVVEGNSRIASYKILAGMIPPPDELLGRVPKLNENEIESLLSVDVQIAPNRERLMPILAELHFGRGDRQFWTFLSSRKAIADEYARIKKVDRVARTFNCKPSEIQDYLVEWELYTQSLAFDWSDTERSVLRKPRLEFNPPIRFLQTKGHPDLVGIKLDKHNLRVEFRDQEARNKFRHLISKLVINRSPGLTATSKFADVFSDYVPLRKRLIEPVDIETSSDPQSERFLPPSDAQGDTTEFTPDSGSLDTGRTTPKVAPLKPGCLFNITVSEPHSLLEQLFREAKTLNCEKFPAAGTALLRVILEAITKNLVQKFGIDPEFKVDSLETAVTALVGARGGVSTADKAVLKDFRKHHLDHLNLSLHANKRPDYVRLQSANHSIVEFIRRNS